MSNPIILILGAGPRVGASTAARFAQGGYRVATASRTAVEGKIDNNRLEIKIDLSLPSAVPEAFRKVVHAFGSSPTVVIYNAAVRTLLPENDPLSSLSMTTHGRDLAVNLNSAVIAAQEAVRGFDILPPSQSKTFIYTGNKLNVMADPKTLSFGVARTGAAHFIWDCSVAYRTKGYKFYFTDERLDDGAPSREVMDPVARGNLYYMLSNESEQGPWHYTYVKARGYVDFKSVDQPWEVFKAGRK